MRILIVENDFTGRNLLKSIMSSLWKCEISEDGENAARVFQSALEHERGFHLILIKFCLSKFDKSELLENIRKIEKKFKVPRENRVKVLMIAALHNYPQILTALNQGVIDAFILEPVTNEKIMCEVKSLGLFDPEQEN